MYKDLDPILHSQLRLAVISILANVEMADFGDKQIDKYANKWFGQNKRESKT